MVINISYKMVDNRKEEYIVLDGAILTPKIQKIALKIGGECHIKILS